MSLSANSQPTADQSSAQLNGEVSAINPTAATTSSDPSVEAGDDDPTDVLTRRLAADEPQSDILEDSRARTQAERIEEVEEEGERIDQAVEAHNAVNGIVVGVLGFAATIAAVGGPIGWIIGAIGALVALGIAIAGKGAQNRQENRMLATQLRNQEENNFNAQYVDTDRSSEIAETTMEASASSLADNSQTDSEDQNLATVIDDGASLNSQNNDSTQNAAQTARGLAG